MSSQRKFTFAISSPDEFLVSLLTELGWYWRTFAINDTDRGSPSSVPRDSRLHQWTVLVLQYCDQPNQYSSNSTQHSFDEKHLTLANANMTVMTVCSTNLDNNHVKYKRTIQVSSIVQAYWLWSDTATAHSICR